MRTDGRICISLSLTLSQPFADPGVPTCRYSWVRAKSQSKKSDCVKRGGKQSDAGGRVLASARRVISHVLSCWDQQDEGFFPPSLVPVWQLAQARHTPALSFCSVKCDLSSSSCFPRVGWQKIRGFSVHLQREHGRHGGTCLIPMLVYGAPMRGAVHVQVLIRPSPGSSSVFSPEAPLKHDRDDSLTGDGARERGPLWVMKHSVKCH
jgi:hypothetical protein